MTVTKITDVVDDNTLKNLPEVAFERTLAEQKIHNFFALISTTYWQPANQDLLHVTCIFNIMNTTTLKLTVLLLNKYYPFCY